MDGKRRSWWNNWRYYRNGEVIEEVIEVIEEEEQEPLDDRKNLIPHSEGLKTIEAALQYISQQEEATPADVICLRKWRDIASQKRAKMQKQSSIKDFFKN
jgi:hypothetical protein